MASSGNLGDGDGTYIYNADSGYCTSDSTSTHRRSEAPNGKKSIFGKIRDYASNVKNSLFKKKTPAAPAGIYLTNFRYGLISYSIVIKTNSSFSHKGHGASTIPNRKPNANRAILNQIHPIKSQRKVHVNKLFIISFPSKKFKDTCI